MENKTSKVLFLRFSSLGDVMLSNFYAMKIKQMHPGWHLTWLVDSMYKELVKSQPWVDEVMTWDRQNEGNKGFIRTIREVRSRGFDILIDMHNTDRSSFFSFFSKIPERYAGRYRLPLAHKFHSFEGLYDKAEKISDCERYLCAPETTARIRNMLFDPDDRPVLTAAIGASYEKKRWPVGNWIEFCIMAVTSGHQIYLTGNGPEEEKNAVLIAESVRDSSLKNLAGKLSIPELVQVIDNSSLTVSGDTGALHIARALGKDTIAMFGPSSIKNVSYVEGLKNVFYCDCPDKGCHDYECVRPCMETISPALVYDRLASIGKSVKLKNADY